MGVESLKVGRITCRIAWVPPCILGCGRQGPSLDNFNFGNADLHPNWPHASLKGVQGLTPSVRGGLFHEWRGPLCMLTSSNPFSDIRVVSVGPAGSQVLHLHLLRSVCVCHPAVWRLCRLSLLPTAALWRPGGSIVQHHKIVCMCAWHSAAPLLQDALVTAPDVGLDDDENMCL